MSRAEELRAAGATVLGDKSEGEKLGPTPFIAWPATAPPTAWVEGVVEELWSGKYGLNATISLTACSDGLTAGGKDTASFEVGGSVGQKFNVGLSSATLKDRVTEDHIAETLHFEFLGWVEPTNGGNRYRQFEIQVVPEGLYHAGDAQPGERWVVGEDDDEKLPF